MSSIARTFFTASFAIIFFPLLGEAKEIDQFTDRLMLMEQLEDGTQEIDQHINLLIQDGVRRLNSKAAHTPATQREVVRRTFQAALFSNLRSPPEEWVDNKSRVENYRVLYRGIYGGAVNFDDMGMGWYVALSPTIKVNGVLMGIDKIGHFFGQGWDYFVKYNELRERPLMPVLDSAALLEQMRVLGDEYESVLLGSVGTGVYSYADLAANWQGFDFYRNLLEGNNPYIVRDAQGIYKQERTFTFRDYVTDDFDEVINPSRIETASFYEHVKQNLNYSRSPTRPSICQIYRQDPVKFMNRSTRPRLPWQDFVHRGDLNPGKAPYVLRLEELCRVTI